MQKLKNCDYYIGLDMGDASVGWAVTDTNYNILKFKILYGQIIGNIFELRLFFYLINGYY